MQNYQDNADIVDGWIWIGAHQARTCLCCLALQGRFFPLTETFQATHPACRCSSRASVKGVDYSNRIPTGKDWFYSQPESFQEQMVPVGAWSDFKAGKLILDDFIYLDKNETWGDRYREASIATARANARKRGQGFDLPMPTNPPKTAPKPKVVPKPGDVAPRIAASAPAKETPAVIPKPKPAPSKPAKQKVKKAIVTPEVVVPPVTPQVARPAVSTVPKTSAEIESLEFSSVKNHLATKGYGFSATQGMPTAEASAFARTKIKGVVAKPGTDGKMGPREAIQRYSGDDYRDVNYSLRNGDKHGVRRLKDMISGLDETIEASTIEEDVVLYRGMNLAPFGNLKTGVGRTIQDKAYVSTSLLPKSPLTFVSLQNEGDGALVRIFVPKGSKGMQVEQALGRDVEALGTEHEVLLPRGSSFRIVAVREPGPSGEVEVDMELVPNE